MAQANYHNIIYMHQGGKEAFPRRSLCWLARESKPSWFNNEILVHFCKSSSSRTTCMQHACVFVAQCSAWSGLYTGMFVCTCCLNSLECNVVTVCSYCTDVALSADSRCQNFEARVIFVHVFVLPRCSQPFDIADNVSFKYTHSMGRAL